MFFRAKSPLRISFGGGGTDTKLFAHDKGGCVLVAAIKRFAFGTLEPRSDQMVEIGSLDYGIALNYDISEPPPYNGELDLVKAAIKRFCSRDDNNGFRLFLHSNVPPGSGLGSSSAMTAVLVGLLKDYKNQILKPYEIADLTYKLEREDLKIAGGLQDQYATVFGGFNFIEFEKDEIIVGPLKIDKHILNELEYSLILCYTGGTRLSANIIEDQTDNYIKREKICIEALDRIKDITIEMKKYLLHGKLNDFGKSLDEEWQNKKKMSLKISTPQIDDMYEESRKSGAIGGKLLGAGGGGYLLLYCSYDKKHRIIERLKKMGGVMMDFAFENEGLQTWRV